MYGQQPNPPYDQGGYQQQQYQPQPGMAPPPPQPYYGGQQQQPPPQQQMGMAPPPPQPYYGGQQQQQQMVTANGAAAPPPPNYNAMNPQNQMFAPQHHQLWPQGVGITDREVKKPGDENDCSCPPCYCFTRPIWFYDRGFQRGGQQSGQTPGCCKWTIDNADVIDHRMSFEGRQCCGTDSCCEPEIHIKNESGVSLGKATMLLPCTCNCCGEVDLCHVKDASGNKKYVRREHMCCPEYRYWSGDFCGWQQYRWPVLSALTPEGQRALPVTHIVMRYHLCAPCHPLWVGIENFPHDATPEDQQLLLGMALCRWWRAEQDQSQDNDNNPAY